MLHSTDFIFKSIESFLQVRLWCFGKNFKLAQSSVFFEGFFQRISNRRVDNFHFSFEDPFCDSLIFSLHYFHLFSFFIVFGNFSDLSFKIWSLQVCLDSWFRLPHFLKWCNSIFDALKWWIPVMSALHDIQTIILKLVNVKSKVELI